ncbi:MAG: hypothetical protein ABDI07_00940 [Candidatus Kryptonium sp.]
MVATIGIITVFVVMALLMFFRIIPALIALPLMAFFIAYIGGIPLLDIFVYVIGDGAFRLHQAYTVAIFGGMLSIFMQKSGIAEGFIRKGAELVGDDPFYVDYPDINFYFVYHARRAWRNYYGWHNYTSNYELSWNKPVNYSRCFFIWVEHGWNFKCSKLDTLYQCFKG